MYRIRTQYKIKYEKKDRKSFKNCLQVAYFLVRVVEFLTVIGEKEWEK